MPPERIALSAAIEKKYAPDRDRRTGDSRGRPSKGGRAFAQLSQGKIAADAGLSHSGVTRIFNGSRWPGRQAAERLAKVLGLSVAEFLQELTNVRRTRRKRRTNSKSN